VPAVAKGHVVHVNSATLLMGATGSGKSSLLATLMEYVYETYGLLSVLYSTDGGGFPDRIQALIRMGICWPWRMRTRDLPDASLSFETIARATQGWLPTKINLQTGETPPGVKLVPPITEQYSMSCPNGHLVKMVPFQSMLTPAMCPTCKTHTTKENMRVTKASHRTKGFEKIGAVMYDGLTSMTSWALQDMGQRAGRLELKGEEGAIGGKVSSGDMKWGGVTRSHIGFAQARDEEWVLNSLSIPYLVVPPTFTVLTLETTDEGGLSVRGPKLAGRAKTDEAGAWVGNCLESAVVKTEKEERQYRLYLSEFIDEAGVRHLVKNRAAPGCLPPYLEDPPLALGNEAETAFTSFNLGLFFQLLDAGLQQTLATVEAKYPNAPGLSGDAVEFGEPVVTALAPAAIGSGTSPAALPVAPKVGSPVARPPAKAKVPPAATQPPAAVEAGNPAAVPPQPGNGQAESMVLKAEDIVEVDAATLVGAATVVTQPAKPATAWAAPGAPRPPAAAPRVGGARK
jgi:energy-coupling factor transporter ATP-binding protein EcfA2